MSSSFRSYSTFTAAALLAALAGSAVAQPPAAVEGRAVLVAPPGIEREIKATASLTVTALPIAVDRPARDGELLVVFDTAPLEQQLAQARQRLANAQSQQRERTSGQEVVRAGSASSSTRTENLTMENATAQADAMRDMTEAQARIAAAPLHAPVDGYVLKHLNRVGTQAKKRKPVVLFAEATKTLLQVTLPEAAAAGFAVGADVRIGSVDDPAASFLGRVEAVEPGAGEVTLRVRPRELPFLLLGAPTAVEITPAR
jgi:multidrug resistance efflux pump